MGTGTGSLLGGDLTDHEDNDDSLSQNDNISVFISSNLLNIYIQTINICSTVRNV